jgi:four helix bundle protein
MGGDPYDSGRVPSSVTLRVTSSRVSLGTFKHPMGVPRCLSFLVFARPAQKPDANYRAACRARSGADFRAKLAVVEEEADESLYWLELLAEAGILPGQALDCLLKEANELVAIFTASRKTARDRSRSIGQSVSP